MELYAIKINGHSDPIGYDFDQIILSWKVRSQTGNRQKNARIEIAQDETFDAIIHVLDGRTLNSLGVKLEFPLEAHTRYYCRITITSDTGEQASGTCFFETAKLDIPWAGKWIGVPDNATHPEFRKAFAFQKKIAKARLYITGLGLFEAFLNGEKVGEDLLAPFLSDYRDEVQYCTYDVTKQLQEKNDLRVYLGKGWYMGRYGLTGHAFCGKEFALLAELHLWYADGSTQIIATDESWLYRPSVFTHTDIYDGETQNYLTQQTDWCNAIAVSPPSNPVQRYSPSVRAMERLSVQDVIHTRVGETVLDFGQNFAGFVECGQLIPKGQTMLLEFGEILQNGCFYRDNYRTAVSKFSYTSDGEQRIIRPHFTFFGFRYAKVTGVTMIDRNCFTGVAVYSAMEQTGFLTTGNEKINKLISNTMWGLKSNFLDLPTDCPQRDERLGWCGDAQVFCPTAGYLMDTRAFYTKFLRQLRADQIKNDGKVAVYLPNEMPGFTAAVWSDVATCLPDMLQRYYGVPEVLRTHYPMMRDWVRSIRKADCERGEKYLWDFGFQFGDWLALDGATEQSSLGRTDHGFVASCYYYASAVMTARAACILDAPESAEFNELAEKIRNAILYEYFSPSGRLAIDTQTGYLLALRFGIYHDKQRIIDSLKTRIKKDLYRIKGGFVGATMMNSVLAENGLSDLAYAFLFYEGFPGWLYAINLGATTIWERWNSVLPDGSISGTGMNSLNHYAYGSVVEFLYRHAAGISPMEPGFRKAKIAPLPEIRLGSVDCSFDSAAGQYRVQWKILRDGQLHFRVEIPFGCEAELHLPEQDIVNLGSGSYTYTIHTQKDYLAVYTADTPMEILLSDPAAVEVLDKHLPGMADSVERKDVEAMSSSLADMRKRTMLFNAPIEGFDAAIRAVSALHWAKQ